MRRGHEVRVLAPCDPDDRLARTLHRGARPQKRPLPDYVVPLGRSVGLPSNGTISSLAFTPGAVGVLGRELRHGGYDLIHVHEPNAPLASWCATETSRVPLVGTFHTYSTSFANRVASGPIGARRLYNKLAVRVAVSEAARWTAENYYGGCYRIIPNGVDLRAARTGPRPEGQELRLLFVGRAEDRKGLPVLMRAFEALQTAGVPARLTVAGATREEIEPFLLDASGVDILGHVSEEEKWRLLHDADLLCAPSLGGESFGIVLTEAFASGTPVVCSDIAGYRDVVRNGLDGLLVTPGRPRELAEALHALALDPERRARMGAAARTRAERFAWPQVAAEVMETYEEAIELPAPERALDRVAVRTGLKQASLEPRGRVRRMPSPEQPEPGAGRRRAARVARRAVVAGGALLGIGLAAMALERIGLEPIGRALVAATPVWVLLAFAVMCASMLTRAEAWHAILRAALPGTPVRRRWTARATMIGVLMSATLPARLGEPSRALIVARRVGRVRERLPVVLGTLVSQTLLNLLALAVLGTVMFATVGLFQGNEDALIVATLAPVLVIGLLLMAPFLLRKGKPSRFARAQQALAMVREAMVQVRHGLDVFRRPRLGGWAAFCQLFAWALQWLSCYLLLVALGLDQQAGIGAAAAVLFAVNVTAVLPATPSNIGVFQAACVAVLAAYGVGHTDALAYGIILQAVEIATALAMGMPALVGEGMSWRDMRIRALHASPVELGVGTRRKSRDAAEIEA
jgi:phosphatidyl-myo-inositol alpha-mannosyltransferase